MYRATCPVCGADCKFKSWPKSGHIDICHRCFSINRSVIYGRFIELQQIPQHELDLLREQNPIFHRDLMTAKKLVMRRTNDF